jgi:ABC-type maltose transport system permease subunit
VDDTETREINRSHKDRWQDSSAIDGYTFIPRLWMIMIPFAVPFLILSFTVCEALERTGPIGAFIAVPLLSVTNIAYMVSIVALKKHKI